MAPAILGLCNSLTGVRFHLAHDRHFETARSLHPLFDLTLTKHTHRKRQKPLSENILGWPLDIWRADHNDIRQQNGMDAFFFVQFLRMMARIFLPIWIVSWAVLLPITDAGKTKGLTGLDQFTFGNVADNQQVRYAAHIILVYGFTCEHSFCFWTITQC
jgi:hypothetical protein